MVSVLFLKDLNKAVLYNHTACSGVTRLASMDDPGKSRVTRESENILIGGVGKSSQASKVDARNLCYE